MSARGSRPKISSERSSEPASEPSKVVIESFIGSSSLAGGRGSLGSLRVGQAERAGLRRPIRQLLLHGVTHEDPAALGAGNGTLDEDQPALDVGSDHLEVQGRDTLIAHVAGHLLAGEGLARVLALAGGAVGAMRDRVAVARTMAGEVPALHRARETLADRRAGDVDELPGHEVVRRDACADRDHILLRDAELHDLPLRLDMGDREMAALRTAGVLDLRKTRAELHGSVAVLVRRPVGDNLAVVELEDGDRDMLAGVVVNAAHADLLCNDT